MLKVHFIKFFLLKRVWISHILTLWAPVSWGRGLQGSEPGQAAAAAGGQEEAGPGASELQTVVAAVPVVAVAEA